MAIVTYPAADGRGTPVHIEVDTVPPPEGEGTTPPPGGTADAAPPPEGVDGIYEGVDTRALPWARAADRTRDVYEDGLRLARTLAAQAANRLGDLGEGLRPDEIELQLAIRLDAELGAVLVKSSAEAQLQVTFRWTPGTGTGPAS